MEKRGRGRPKGHRLSDESREKISAARRAQEAQKRALLVEARCAGCDDVWRDAKGRIVDRTASRMEWEDGSVDVLCGFCTRNALDMEATSLRMLWGTDYKQHE